MKLKIKKADRAIEKTRKIGRLVTWLQGFVVISGFPGRAVFI